MAWLLGYVGELQAFARSLLSRTPGRADPTDGAKALKVGEAVWRSIKQGRAVAID
jgi:predicted dehydrogenase